MMEPEFEEILDDNVPAVIDRWIGRLRHVQRVLEYTLYGAAVDDSAAVARRQLLAQVIEVQRDILISRVSPSEHLLSLQAENQPEAHNPNRDPITAAKKALVSLLWFTAPMGHCPREPRSRCQRTDPTACQSHSGLTATFLELALIDASRRKPSETWPQG